MIYKYHRENINKSNHSQSLCVNFFYSNTGVPTVNNAPILMIRPRAWNMIEHNFTVNGTPIPGPIVDFALVMFHHGAEMQGQGAGPFFYLSKVRFCIFTNLLRDTRWPSHYSVFTFISLSLNSNQHMPQV